MDQHKSIGVEASECAQLSRVPGFLFSGVACGIKSENRRDLALVYAEGGCNAAGVFTTNRVKAAPVLLAQERIGLGPISCVVVNSGNANACTGMPGYDAAVATTQLVAARLGVEAQQVLPASTGVIGVPLPLAAIERGVGPLVDSLEPEVGAFAESILTTDRCTKIASTSLILDGKRASILAVAKGAGMIHPNMATTLGFVMTDAVISRPMLRRVLLRAAADTFNRISVDGDTSTNDAIFLMASGALENHPIPASSPEEHRLLDSVTCVLEQVAKMIVQDGEGAEHLIRVQVNGAPSEEAGVRVARTVATSSLVKTALFGRDPNWGRVLAAMGRSGVDFDPEKVEIWIGDVAVYRFGVSMNESAEKEASAAMHQEQYTLEIRLHSGSHDAWYWTCDLGHSYVSINANYRS
ncbi:MAG: bifunctional glutamate N-acetyltransferase/amino-acid acetyltransferase ArgJ [Myxococcota bacterium]